VDDSVAGDASLHLGEQSDLCPSNLERDRGEFVCASVRVFEPTCKNAEALRACASRSCQPTDVMFGCLGAVHEFISRMVMSVRSGIAHEPLFTFLKFGQSAGSTECFRCYRIL